MEALPAQSHSAVPFKRRAEHRHQGCGEMGITLAANENAFLFGVRYPPLARSPIQVRRPGVPGPGVDSRS
jgi:hypothetical protein